MKKKGGEEGRRLKSNEFLFENDKVSLLMNYNRFKKKKKV